MGFFDELASGINGLIFPTRIDDGVRGTAQVISATGYYGHAIYQNCHLELVVEAPGIPATAVSLNAVVHRQHWPQPGAVLPALIEKANPQEVEILWDETVDSRTAARAEAERVAAERRGERPSRPAGGGAGIRRQPARARRRRDREGRRRHLEDHAGAEGEAARDGRRPRRPARRQPQT